MHKKLNLDKNIFFLIEFVEESYFTEDDVRLFVVFGNEKIFLEQDSYRYEVGHGLKYFCDPKNYIETDSEDIGYDYYLFECELEKGNIVQNIHDFDYFVAFSSNNIAVLFFKKDSALFCEITKNDIGETYKCLFLKEVSLETLMEWENILNEQ